MIVSIELITKENKRITKSDIDKNIQALKRFSIGDQTIADSISLLDTLSILYAIKKQLPE